MCSGPDSKEFDKRDKLVAHRSIWIHLNTHFFLSLWGSNLIQPHHSIINNSLNIIIIYSDISLFLF